VNQFCGELRSFGLTVETSRFGANMLVSIDNDGPVTIWLDSEEKRSS
jgi:D-tyrosyl-tRNA(Tyr) deacylase